MSQTVNNPPAVSFTGALSRKVHGAAGPFDLTIDTNQSVTGSPTIEPRVVGAGHKLVFQFSGPVSLAGTATCVDENNATLGAISLVQANGSTVEVTVGSIPDGKRARVSLAGVNGSASASAPIAFLAGDLNASRSVTASDILRSKGKAGQLASAPNFVYDTDLSGTIGSSDVDAVKARAGFSY
jgi:hypothetical protein